jgi:hypothetical protein
MQAMRADHSTSRQKTYQGWNLYGMAHLENDNGKAEYYRYILEQLNFH